MFTEVPLHPVIVHLPIALAFLIPFLAMVFGHLIHNGTWPKSVWITVIALQALLVIGAGVAIKTGEISEEIIEASESKNTSGGNVDRHEENKTGEHSHDTHEESHIDGHEHAGHDIEEHIEEHEEAGEAFLYFSIFSLILSIAPIVLKTKPFRPLAFIFIIAAFIGLGLGFNTGKIGGELVYNYLIK